MAVAPWFAPPTSSKAQEDWGNRGSEQTAAFEAAFAEYASAYREGRATGLAQDDMSACIAAIQQMIDARYAPKEEEEDPVLVIGATAAPKS